MKHLKRSKDDEQADILKRYYPYDEEKRVFTITLTYASCKDIFEAPQGPSSCQRKMKQRVIDDICEILADIPKGHQVDFLLHIDDYEGMDPKDVLAAFDDILFLRHRRYQARAKGRMIKACSLLIAGFAVAFLLVVGEIRGWWPTNGGVTDRLLAFLFDAVAGVLIWEGVFFAFIERSEGLINGQNLSTKLRSFSIRGSKAANEKTRELISSMAITKPGRLCYSCFMLAGYGFFASAITTLAVTLPYTIIFVQDASLGLAPRVIGVIFFCVFPFVVSILAGISSLKLFYEDRAHWHLKVAIAILVLIGYSLRVVGFIIDPFEFESIVSLVFESIVFAAFATGFITYCIWENFREKCPHKS